MYNTNAIKKLLSSISSMPEDGCWIWKGPIHRYSNYGLFCCGNVKMHAHRASWQIFNKKEIPTGLLIRHSSKCISRLCVNPNHLITGTIADNMQDRVEADGYVRGSKHKNARVTEEQVASMRQAYFEGTVTYQDLANTYGLSRSGIESILRGIKWKHVPNPLDTQKFSYTYAAKGLKHWHTTLTDEQVLTIRQLKKDSISMVKIARIFGITYNTVTKICYGITWKHLPI